MALDPPDLLCCQAEQGGAFTLGPGLMRCGNAPVVVATENEPGDDGLHGAMSLCESCQEEFLARFDAEYATFTEIEND
jgi:hypothetical protein